MGNTQNKTNSSDGVYRASKNLKMDNVLTADRMQMPFKSHVYYTKYARIPLPFDIFLPSTKIRIQLSCGVNS